MTDGDKLRIRQYRMQGLGHTKIARMLGLSVNTVKSYCRRNQVTRSHQNADGVCRQCGVKLEYIPHRKKKHFCSDACRLRWWHAHREQSKKAKASRCEYYGSEFVTDHVQKYCSHACYIRVRFGGAQDADQRAV